MTRTRQPLFQDLAPDGQRLLRLAVRPNGAWVEVRLQLPHAALRYVQPEIAHTGVTQFLAIARHARACGARIAPHATIGVGIFMAASLHASAAVDDCAWHEYQHSVFDRNLAHVDTAMRCEAGRYVLPQGPGIGATPRESLWAYRMDL